MAIVLKFEKKVGSAGQVGHASSGGLKVGKLRHRFSVTEQDVTGKLLYQYLPYMTPLYQKTKTCVVRNSHKTGFLLYKLFSLKFGNV